MPPMEPPARREARTDPLAHPAPRTALVATVDVPRHPRAVHQLVRHLPQRLRPGGGGRTRTAPVRSECLLEHFADVVAQRL